jgi:hypothetical protein
VVFREIIKRDYPTRQMKNLKTLIVAIIAVFIVLFGIYFSSQNLYIY